MRRSSTTSSGAVGSACFGSGHWRRPRVGSSMVRSVAASPGGRARRRSAARAASAAARLARLLDVLGIAWSSARRSSAMRSSSRGSVIAATCDLGLRMSSRALPTRVKERTTRTTQTAGGAMYHHAPRPGAPASCAESRIWPHDGANGSPRPMNDRLVSMKTAAAKVMTAWATIRLTTFGKMCRRMMWPEPLPMTRARSTNMRSRIESVCERMIRAVVAHDVMPMTTTMTSSVARSPKNSASTR